MKILFFRKDTSHAAQIYFYFEIQANVQRRIMYVIQSVTKKHNTKSVEKKMGKKQKH